MVRIWYGRPRPCQFVNCISDKFWGTWARSSNIGGSNTPLNQMFIIQALVAPVHRSHRPSTESARRGLWPRNHCPTPAKAMHVRSEKLDGDGKNPSVSSSSHASKPRAFSPLDIWNFDIFAISEGGAQPHHILNTGKKEVSEKSHSPPNTTLVELAFSPQISIKSISLDFKNPLSNQIPRARIWTHLCFSYFLVHWWWKNLLKLKDFSLAWLIWDNKLKKASQTPKPFPSPLDELN